MQSIFAPPSKVHSHMLLVCRNLTTCGSLERRCTYLLLFLIGFTDEVIIALLNALVKIFLQKIFYCLCIVLKIEKKSYAKKQVENCAAE